MFLDADLPAQLTLFKSQTMANLVAWFSANDDAFAAVEQYLPHGSETAIVENTGPLAALMHVAACVGCMGEWADAGSTAVHFQSQLKDFLERYGGDVDASTNVLVQLHRLVPELVGKVLKSLAANGGDNVAADYAVLGVKRVSPDEEQLVYDIKVACSLLTRLCVLTYDEKPVMERLGQFYKNVDYSVSTSESVTSSVSSESSQIDGVNAEIESLRRIVAELTLKVVAAEKSVAAGVAAAAAAEQIAEGAEAKAAVAEKRAAAAEKRAAAAEKRAAADHAKTTAKTTVKTTAKDGDGVQAEGHTGIEMKKLATRVASIETSFHKLRDLAFKIEADFQALVDVTLESCEQASKCKADMEAAFEERMSRIASELRAVLEQENARSTRLVEDVMALDERVDALSSQLRRCESRVAALTTQSELDDLLARVHAEARTEARAEAREITARLRGQVDWLLQQTWNVSLAQWRAQLNGETSAT